MALVHGVEAGHGNVTLSQGLATVSSRRAACAHPPPPSPPCAAGFMACCPDVGVMQVEQAVSSSAGGVLGVLLVARSLGADAVLGLLLSRVGRTVTLGHSELP